MASVEERSVNRQIDQKMTEPIKILDLRDSPWVDGPGRTVLETVQSLDLRAFSVLVGGFYEGDLADNVYLNGALDRSLSILPIKESRSLDWRVVPQVLDAIHKYRIEILHTHDFRSNLVGLICKLKTDVAVISTCHGWITNNLKGRIYKRIDLLLLSRFDHIITVSEALRREIASKGLRRERVTVIPNALVEENFDPSRTERTFRKELKVPDSAVLLVNVGRLSREKGQDLLLQAFARVGTEAPTLYLAFVGKGPEEDKLRNLAGELGLGQAVRFAGFRRDMASVYKSADLVIQSSLTEGMPNVVLEALLMETPVVATDVGGTAEIVEHGKTGYLVAPNSIRQLEDGIRAFVRNRPGHKKMAARGRDHVRKNFGHADRVRRIGDLYTLIYSNMAQKC